MAVEILSETEFVPLARNVPVVGFAPRIKCFLSSALIILHVMGLCTVITLFTTVLADLEDGSKKACHPANAAPALPVLTESAGHLQRATR